MVYLKTSKQGQASDILLFGKGLIGTAIFDELFNAFDETRIQDIPFSWTDTTQIERELEHIFSNQQLSSSNDVYIIWCAGAAGFSATIEDTNKELIFFEQTILSIQQLISLEKQNNKRYHFVLFSSAGGLHENQKHVNDSDNLNIERPYGTLKKKQEEIILKHKNSFENLYIFRLSTVYSIANFNGRKGLISTLFLNAFSNSVSTIFGSANTIRDYISDRSIGEYVSSLIGNKIQLPNHINYLISGKPTSIFELKKRIEKILKKKLYLKYKFIKTNAADITFSPNLVANGYKSGEILSDLKLICENIVK